MQKDVINPLHNYPGTNINLKAINFAFLRKRSMDES
jgi:hypothetical protein